MNLSKATKNIIMMICIVALVFIIGGVAFHRSIHALYFALGVIITSSLNVVKMYLVERTVNNTLEIENQESGKIYVKLQFLLRYVITIAVLLGVGLINVFVEPPFISIWGTIAGLFTLQVAVIIVRHRKLDDE